MEDDSVRVLVSLFPAILNILETLRIRLFMLRETGLVGGVSPSMHDERNSFATNLEMIIFSTHQWLPSLSCKRLALDASEPVVPVSSCEVISWVLCTCVHLAPFSDSSMLKLLNSILNVTLSLWNKESIRSIAIGDVTEKASSYSVCISPDRRVQISVDSEIMDDYF